MDMTAANGQVAVSDTAREREPDGILDAAGVGAESPAPVRPLDTASEGPATGIVRELGELPSGAVITEAGLARMLGRHPVTIKRAVRRGELPPPTRLLGTPVWLAGAIIGHIQKRLDAAAKEAERQARKFQSMRP